MYVQQTIRQFMSKHVVEKHLLHLIKVQYPSHDRRHLDNATKLVIFQYWFIISHDFDCKLNSKFIYLRWFYAVNNCTSFAAAMPMCIEVCVCGSPKGILNIERWNNHCLDKSRSNLQNVPNLRILWHLLLFHMPCVVLFLSPQMRYSQIYMRYLWFICTHADDCVYTSMCILYTFFQQARNLLSLSNQQLMNATHFNEVIVRDWLFAYFICDLMNRSVINRDFQHVLGLRNIEMQWDKATNYSFENEKKNTRLKSRAKEETKSNKTQIEWFKEELIRIHSMNM